MSYKAWKHGTDLSKVKLPSFLKRSFGEKAVAPESEKGDTTEMVEPLPALDEQDESELAATRLKKEEKEDNEWLEAGELKLAETSQKEQDGGDEWLEAGETK